MATRIYVVSEQVIIDSQPLTVAVLAAFLYGEILGPKSITALAFGIFGLILIEVSMMELTVGLPMLSAELQYIVR
jgi:drug/metabolite transporter (DMT)-like permease